MEPLSISFYAVSGFAVFILLICLKLLRRIKILRNDHSLEHQKKTSEITDLTSRADKLRNNLEEAKSEIKNLKSGESSLNTKLRKLDETIASASKECLRRDEEKKAGQETINRQEQFINEAKAKTATLGNNLRQKEKELDKFQSTNQALSKKLEELKGQLEEFRKDNRAKEEVILREEEKFKQFLSENSKLQDTLKDKEQCLIKVKNSSHTLAVKIQELQSQVESLRIENKADRETIVRQEEELEAAISARTQLQGALREEKGQVEKMRENIEAANSNIEELRAQNETLTQEKTGNRETILRQEQELQQSNAQGEELRETLQDREQRLEQIQNTNRIIMEKMSALELQIRGLEKERNTQEKIISRQEEELKEALENLAKEKDTLKQKNQQNKNFKEANQAMAEKIEGLETGMQKITEEKQADQEIISYQREELEQVSSKRAELEDSFKEAQDALRRLSAEINQLKSHLQDFKENTQSKEGIISSQEEELEKVIAKSSEIEKGLKEKEAKVNKLEDSSTMQSKQIKQFQSQVASLTGEKRANQESMVRQRIELEKTVAQYLEANNTLQEKEQQLKELKKANENMIAALKKKEAKIEGLEKGTLTQSVIIAESKRRNKKSSDDALSKQRNKLQEDREEKEKRLPQVLLGYKLTTEEKLEKARQVKGEHGGSLLQFLFVNRDIDENKLVECISSKLNVPYLALGAYNIPQELVGLVPAEIVEKYWLVPVDKIGDSLMVVMVDPFDSEAIKELEQITGCIVKTYIGLFSEIARKIQRLYKINIRSFDAEGNLVSPIFVNSLEYTGRERRRAIRFKANFAAHIIHNHSVDRLTTEDISWDGLSFRLEHDLPIYSMVTIQMDIPEFKDKAGNQLPVTAVAQVIRIKHIENKHFMIGVKFLKIAKEDLSAVLEYVVREKEKEPELGTWQKIQKLASGIIS